MVAILTIGIWGFIGHYISWWIPAIGVGLGALAFIAEMAESGETWAQIICAIIGAGFWWAVIYYVWG